MKNLIENLSVESLLAEGADEAEPLGELGKEDKDFLSTLEKMVEEVESESSKA